MASATNTQYVWYGSFGSNLNSERFACYLRGGKVAGMSIQQPGARDTHVPFRIPPTSACPTASMVVPHRMFFAKVSPWWSNGGVAFLDCEKKEENEELHTHLRLWRISLEQFSDVFAQENGLHPAEFHERFTKEEVLAMAERGGGDHRIGNGSWYGYVKALGAFTEAGAVEPILTFTLPPVELEAIRSGVVDEVNPPSMGYHDVIARGLVELGLEATEADAYLRARYSLR